MNELMNVTGQSEIKVVGTLHLQSSYGEMCLNTQI